MVQKFLGSDKNIQLLSRYTRVDGNPAFDWTGSGFRLCFVGKSIILSFAELKTPYTFYVAVKLDGRRQRFPISTGNEKIVFENLADKKHCLEFVKITETTERLVFTECEVSGKAPDLVACEALPQLKIEFVGDSLTAGYGNLAPATEKLFHTFEQDSGRAYAALCADILGADAHFVCYSGKGIYFNCHGVFDYEIPTFFNHASLETKEPWDFSAWTPDAVVINAGTNDFCGGIDEDTFEKAALGFLKQVRETYPNAYIFWAYGMTQKVATAPLKRAVAAFADSKAFFIELSSMYDHKDEIGGNGHPNVKSATRTAKFVAKRIKEVMGL